MKKIECVIMDWAGTAVDYGARSGSRFPESFCRERTDSEQWKKHEAPWV